MAGSPTGLDADRYRKQPPGSQTGATVVLTSRAWGHEGGDQITAEFLNPGVANSPLSVAVIGNDISVSLATNSAGALSSTAAQVVAAINAHPGAAALVKALTYRGQRRRGNRPGPPEGEPGRLPERAGCTSSVVRSSSGHADRLSGVTASAPASSSTASSTPASGRRR